MVKKLNVSIVLFNSEFSQIVSLINILKSDGFVNNIYLIDNSPNRNDAFQIYESNYIFTGKNLGYGAGHNIAIRKTIQEEIKYHLVLNSDISLDSNVLRVLLQKMDIDSQIGMIMPKVLNLDGTVQLLPKLLPTPFHLLFRVLRPLGWLFSSILEKYTLSNFEAEELNMPIISGCFSLFRVEALKKVGLYDESFFMYFEDFDLSRRIHSAYKTIYYPNVSVIHSHERGASKSFKLFKAFMYSAIIYFNKYGWFFDRERVLINKATLLKVKNK